ncbi:hypothetical protein BVRB_007980 [Beta vulgaris subsp. vulgaris]|uniref:Uncharacterized protein n=1 Tax=Beta vulgaris subsp. vulgaris TaxID=3555 RepID=A0A0J8B392_BETVV|nr:hypothetical protein BVRB_007980 [Beta vulgaris subsp. vulgaris]
MARLFGADRSHSGVIRLGGGRIKRHQSWYQYGYAICLWPRLAERSQDQLLIICKKMGKTGIQRLVPFSTAAVASFVFIFRRRQLLLHPHAVAGFR